MYGAWRPPILAMAAPIEPAPSRVSKPIRSYRGSPRRYRGGLLGAPLQNGFFW
ncbi:MAG: hypothetical protein ACLRWP_11800 [Bilophila wadsworthia]